MREDDKLIEGLKKGDANSYETLFHRYYGKFVHFADCILQNFDDARDIVQEAFIRLYNNRESLQQGLSIENYLYVIVKRLLLNFIRDRKWHADITSQLIDSQLVTQLGGVKRRFLRTTPVPWSAKRWPECPPSARNAIC